MIDVAKLEHEQARWYNRLFDEALRETGDLGEALLATELAMSVQPHQPAELPDEPLDGMFSFDIYNRKAQGVLNRALAAASGLSRTAKGELEAAIRLDDPAASSVAVVEFVNRYRTKLAQLLGHTQLAALLEGAREIADRIPVVPPAGAAVPPPPTLPPVEAVKLLDRLRAMADDLREQTLYALPSDQQQYAWQALNVPPPPSESFVPVLGADEPGSIHFPIIEEATKVLSEKNVLTRDQFDRLDAATKQKSFTIAGIDAQDTLTKIRDIMAENVKKGADYEAFRVKVLEDVDAGAILAPGHMENVFRTNVQAAFSDGQMKVLKHPFVRSGFPYAMYSAIDDDRVRHEHLEMEKHGIEKTNIYRTDDPVLRTFLPPWSWNCRCSWFPMTIRQAAEHGITEAAKWLESGTEPTPPAFVSPPPFEPPSGFHRSLNDAPLSIQLSMQPLEMFGDVSLGMVGDEWHGPQPPGPDWVLVGQGKRGGKVWKPKYRVEVPVAPVASTQPAKPTVQPSAQPAAGPMHGHPFADKSLDEILSLINKHGGTKTHGVLATMDNPNPFGYNTAQFPKGFSPKVGEAVVQAVTAQHKQNPFQRLTIPQLYMKAREIQPTLTVWDFQNALAKMHKDQQIFLSAFTQAPQGIPEPQMVMPLGRELKWYVEPPRR